MSLKDPPKSAQFTPSDRGQAPVIVGGHFQVMEELAAGGMGSVYRAVDLRGGELIALKRLRAANSSRDVGLFEREYQTLVNLQHPRIVKAYDYGVDALGPYYTMELVQGTDLHSLAPIAARDACRHVRDVASCLALLHARRLLHRDITPRNVRVLPDGTCKLIDFGALASFGVPDRVVGTPPFVPPEALQAHAALDQRSDVFALGALLYWTLTRKHGYPARRLEALPEAWRERPIPPRHLVPDIPADVEALVLRMIAVDPLARPATMAEVVERLNASAALEPEPAEVGDALALSYLANAGFVGREAELAALRRKLDALEEGRGSATLVVGTRGVGRTRLLSEVTVQGQLQGLNTLSIDGDDCRVDDYASVAIVRHLLATSQAAREKAPLFRDCLLPLGPGIVEHLQGTVTATKTGAAGRGGRLPDCATAMVCAAAAETPVLLTVDNLDEVDDASLATLAGLARSAAESRVALVLTARTDATPRTSILWQLLRDECERLALEPLSPEATIILARSMFGDAPHVARFGAWLHELSGGLPLHVVELARRLLGAGLIGHQAGSWWLPSERPELSGDDGFAGLVAMRLTRLSKPGRALAEALAVQRSALARGLCFELAQLEGDPRALLDELCRHEVVTPSLYGFYFSHATLRDLLLRELSAGRRRLLHTRCAERLLSDTSLGDRRRVNIEAGWHLLEAGEDSRGAERIAEAAVDTVGLRFALLDVPDFAPALEAALTVYKKQDRTLYERLPLMSALAMAGYYGDRSWGERHGDAALAAVTKASGVELAGRLQPVFGRVLGLVIAVSIAGVRFTLSRKRGPSYSFREVFVQLFGVVTTLTGAASIALDVERAERFASALSPFRGLYGRLSPVGVAQFCFGLKEIGRDNQAATMRSWLQLLKRFRSPRYYVSLPDSARALYIGGLLFAIGSISVFRDGRAALQAADELDVLDTNLYRMIASAIRAQYWAHRGQFDQAARFRRQVDDHAVKVGTAWQAELWEPASLLLVHTATGDVAEMRRVVDRLRALSREAPSLNWYVEFAEFALMLTVEERFTVEAAGGRIERLSTLVAEAMGRIRRRPARSFIGWGAGHGYCARALNMLGRPSEAKAVCEDALRHMDENDRPFVALYLGVELELIVADASLGLLDLARSRLAALKDFHKGSDNPLTQGRMHEAAARVAAATGNWDEFRRQLEHTRVWYQLTQSAALVGRVEALRALDPAHSASAGRIAPSTQRLTRAAAMTDSSGIERTLPPEDITDSSLSSDDDRR